MGEISVELNAVSTAIKKCRAVQTSLKAESEKMIREYESLGSDWNDEKYRELGQIIHKCSDALKKPLSELKRCDVFLHKLHNIICEYEGIHFNSRVSAGVTTDSVSSQGHSSSITGDSVGSNGRGIISNIFNRNKDINRALRNVEHRPIRPSCTERTEQQIISSISGGDMTKGSCSSLALAYAGNRAGYIVYDFRDGQSRMVFSLRSTIEQIATMHGVDSIIEHGTDDTLCAERLMSNMEQGREYYMATGRHAAVVRLNNDGRYQYLELQSGNPNNNGWQPLTQRALYERFACESTHGTEWSNYLISLDSLQNNTEFLNLLGYINTDESMQMRGESGHVR